MARQGIKVQYTLVAGTPEVQWITDPEVDLNTLVKRIAEAIENGDLIDVAPERGTGTRLINGRYIVSAAIEVLA